MGLIAVALLLAAPDHVDPNVNLPLVAAFEDAATTGPVLTINLTRHGEIRFDRAQTAHGDKAFLETLKRQGLKPGLRSVSLEELGTCVSQAKRSYSAAQKAKGKSGFDKVGRVEMCALSIDLRADREALWGHVQLLLTILAEERYYKVRMVALRPDGTAGLLDMRLPTWASNGDVEPFDEFLAQVSLRAIAEKEALWGPPGSAAMVALATDVKCAYGDRAFDWKLGWSRPSGRTGLGTWIRRARKTVESTAAKRGGVAAAELSASPKVPVQHCATVLALFRSAAFKQVRFYSGAIPARQARTAPRLAYPARNDLPKQVLGDPPTSD